MIVFILGMHRSGTSAVAGILNIAGGWVGETLGPAKDNPKGFFENKEFMRINRRLLRVNGGRWDDPPNIIEFKDIKSRMVKFLESLPKDKVIILKDPRAALTFHLWHKLIPGDDIRIINVKRNSEAIAKSLQKRNKFSLDKGLSLTRYYNTEIAMNLLAVKRDYIYTIHFTELFSDYRRILIEDMIKITSLPELTQKRWNKIEKFIEPKLRHF